MERICENEKCYGCGACYVICPKNAISMKEDVVTGHNMHHNHNILDQSSMKANV